MLCDKRCFLQSHIESALMVDMANANEIDNQQVPIQLLQNKKSS